VHDSVMQGEHQVEARQISPNMADAAFIVHLKQAQAGPTQQIDQDPNSFMMLSLRALIISSQWNWSAKVTMKRQLES